MNAQYVIEQIQSDPEIWRLSVRIEEGWKLVDTFGSEAAAIAAMSVLVARSKWTAAPPKYYDATGTLMP
jgi:uncharacterized protein YbdZ (MbtH family)